MDTQDKLYNFLTNFNNQSLDQQGDFTGKLTAILDIVAEGVWSQQDAGFYSYSQCAFCCVSPESEHDEWCPVAIARKIKDEL